MKRSVFIVVLGLATAACTQQQGPATETPLVVTETPEQRANASSGISMVDDSIDQLAIPVEVSSSGVAVVGDATLIRAPRPQPGPGPQLVVTIHGFEGSEQFQREYQVPDPRPYIIEGVGPRVSPRATTFVYVALSDPATRINIRPSPSEAGSPFATGMPWTAAATSTIPLSRFSSVACVGSHASSPLCRQIAPK